MRKYGDNFWYISLNDKRPKNRNVISIQIKKNYSIIELSTEADPDIIDHCKLVYCGYGHWKEEHIQENISKYI
ncbi:hypothetical protein P7E02_24310 [Enterococcus hulanensis]|nr:hypothetical protein [Enterococcus hulanensis]MDT2663007.1 hypothetical protein [Enterococcus hulanensis]